MLSPTSIKTQSHSYPAKRRRLSLNEVASVKWKWYLIKSYNPLNNNHEDHSMAPSLQPFSHFSH